jgi:hypothetical protein
LVRKPQKKIALENRRRWRANVKKCPIEIGVRVCIQIRVSRLRRTVNFCDYGKQP